MSILSYLFPKTIAVIDSKYNGKIYVKEAFGKKYIEVGGLMQSGRLLNKLFSKGLEKISKLKKTQDVKKILMLGVGGGTLLSLLRSKYSEALILAVDIDETIVSTGKKYLGLEFDNKMTLLIGDAFNGQTDLGKNYDLIIVDLFAGYEVPKDLSSKKFLSKIKLLLNSNGLVVFNRLYFQKYKMESDLFIEELRKNFPKVDTLKHYFNILIFGTI